jgi:hypothetical protein
LLEEKSKKKWKKKEGKRLNKKNKKTIRVKKRERGKDFFEKKKPQRNPAKKRKNCEDES